MRQITADSLTKIADELGTLVEIGFTFEPDESGMPRTPDAYWATLTGIRIDVGDDDHTIGCIDSGETPQEAAENLRRFIEHETLVDQFGNRYCVGAVTRF